MPDIYRAVILDVDGTLVDSNDAHAHAWIESFQNSGRQVPFEKVRRLIGMGGDKLLPQTVGVSKESPEGKELSRQRGEIFKMAYLPTLRPFPGTRDLLEHMHRAGLTLVISSSAEEEELKALLKIAGAEPFISHTTSSQDVANSKPDPDPIQSALRQAGQPPEAALMVGDTPYDIEAAGKAGVRTIAFRCGGWQDDGLAGALAIYDGPADLLARWAQSPLGH